MNFVVLKSCALFLVLYLESNLAHTIRWKSLMNELNKQIDNNNDERRDLPKHWVIFIVGKSLLRSQKLQGKQLENNFNRHALEPYKSLQLMVEDDVRSRISKKKKEKEEKRKTIDNFSEEALGGLRLTKEQTELLRKSWRSSCNRKAARVCKKACTLSYKRVCRTYRCLRSQKRNFKRECARNCKMKFRG